MPIKVNDFIMIFRDSGIRSWFDWKRLESSGYSVIEICSRSKSILGSLETVWYIRPDGSLGDWRNQSDRRVRVEEAARLSSFPDEKRFRYIEDLTAHIQNIPAPLILTLPCYRTESGKLLILDGNHRAVAAFKSEQDVRLLAFAITGIDNALMLPDLLHETDANLSPDVWAKRCAEIEQNFIGS